MNRTLWMLAVIVTLGGCTGNRQTTGPIESPPNPRGDENAVARNSEGPTPSNPAEGSKPSNGDKSATTDANGSPSGGSTTPAPPQPNAPPVIKEWKPVKNDLGELGDKLDQSVSKLEKAYAEVITYLETDEIRGQQKLKINIENFKKYRIQYMVGKETSSAYMVADGTSQATFEKEKWESKPSLDTPNGGNPLKNLDRIQSEMFDPLVDKRPYWGPLLRQLSRSDSGFETKLETTTTEVNGTKRNLFAVRAKNKKNPAETIEIRIDGMRNIPIGIMIRRPKFTTQWSSRWAFGQPMSGVDYSIPAQGEQ